MCGYTARRPCEIALEQEAYRLKVMRHLLGSVVTAEAIAEQEAAVEELRRQVERTTAH